MAQSNFVMDLLIIEYEFKLMDMLHYDACLYYNWSFALLCHNDTVQYRMNRSEDHWLVYLITGGCWSTSSHALITLLFSGVTLPDERALQFCSSFHRCLVQPGNAGPIQLHTLKPTILLWQMPQHCNVCICDQMGIQLTAQMKKGMEPVKSESCFIFKGTVHQIINPFWLEGSINHQYWKKRSNF